MFTFLASPYSRMLDNVLRSLISVKHPKTFLLFPSLMNNVWFLSTACIKHCLIHTHMQLGCQLKWLLKGFGGKFWSQNPHHQQCLIKHMFYIVGLVWLHDMPCFSKQCWLMFYILWVWTVLYSGVSEILVIAVRMETPTWLPQDLHWSFWSQH